jgi:hypothetical protein
LSLAAASPASVRTVGLKWYAALLCGQAGIELPVHISLRRFAQFLRGFRAGDDFVVVLWRLSAIQRRSGAPEVFKPFLAKFGVAGFGFGMGRGSYIIRHRRDPLSHG